MKFMLVLLWTVLVYFPLAYVHELGHVIFGKIVGFRFCFIVFGPIGIKKDENNTLHFYIEKNISFWAGVSLNMPKNLDDIDREVDKFSITLLGGPILSIVIGMCFLILSGLEIYNLLFISGAMSVGMGIACLIPMPAGAFYSDGGRWIRIHRKETREIEKAILRSEWNAGEDEDYSQILDDDIDVLIKAKEWKSKYMGYYYMYKKNLYIKNISNANFAKTEMEKLKKLVPKDLVKLCSNID